MHIDVKVLDCRLYVEGNHDCDIETHMWYLIRFLDTEVKELERLYCHLTSTTFYRE